MYKAKKPLLSIVIPTRDREEYALSCIRPLLRWKSDETEIIVQDNSCNDSLKKKLSGQIDAENIRYIHDPIRTSIIDNCDHAMLRVQGGFVTLLGDDDS